MAVGAHAYRRTFERRAADLTKQKEEKRNRTKEGKKTTPEKGEMASASKKCPEDTSSSHLWLINYGERTSTSEHACLGLSSSWFFPSCSGIPVPTVVQAFSAARSILHETFYLLFRRLAPFPLVLACSRSLVGIDTESSEVVHQITHHVSLLPHAGRAPHQFSQYHSLRQSCVIHTRHKPREKDPPPAQNCLHALTPHHYERMQMKIGWLVRLFFRQPMERARKLWWARRRVSHWHSRGLHVTQPYSIISYLGL